MPKIISTQHELSLIDALNKRGIKTISPFWDGHKHVDIYIPDAQLYIEVDGIQHYTDAKQFKADLQRDHYSNDDKMFTKRISNQLIDSHVEEIADAIKEIVKK